MAGQLSPVILPEHVRQFNWSQHFQSADAALSGAGAVKFHGLARISILERLWIKIREHIAKETFQVPLALSESGAEIFDFPATFLNQRHEGWLLRCFGEDLNQKTT